MPGLGFAKGEVFGEMLPQVGLSFQLSGHTRDKMPSFVRRSNRMSTRMLLPFLSLAGGALLLLAPSARAQDGSEFLGTYATTGTYSTSRHTAADLEVTRDGAGNLSVSRTGRFTSVRYRNLPPFTWTTSEVKLEGGELKVVYRVGVDGTSASSSGINNALAGAQAGAGTISPAAGLDLRAKPGTNGQLVAHLAGGTALKVLRGVDRQGQGPWAWLEVEAQVGGATKRGFVPADDVLMTSGVNVFEATYRLEGNRLVESVQNRTRFNPEAWWSSVSSAGDRLSSPTVDVQRLKLGGQLQVKAGGRYNVIVPTDGTLKVKLSAGAMTLKDPSGTVVGQGSGELAQEIPHTAPVLGSYTVEVDAAAEGATLSGTFVQDGRIDPRIRPWSVHTHFPVYEFSGGTSENQNNLFHRDGPLDKFDRALSLTGHDRAVWWEKGTDYRTSFGFERGAYTRISSPSEKTAEMDWFADLNGDGVIETADVTSAVYFARFDANGDGKITSDEARPKFEEGAVQSLFMQYDADVSGKIEKSEIFEQFITNFDKDGSGDIDLQEWREALNKAYKNVLGERSGAALERFLRQDADESGDLTPGEVEPPGAIDFMDSSDVDGDFNSFFDRDNVQVIDQAGKSWFGNKTERANGKLKLFKGPKKDQLVSEFDEAQVKRVKTGVADGDLDDSYSVGWWGHCNAWSMASIIFRKPEGEMVRNGVTFSVRDQKGILVTYGMGATEDSTFWWQQWGDEIPPAAYAAGFHNQLHRWLKVEQKGMMADLDLKNPHNNLNFAVWNYPLLGYQATLKEAEGDDPHVLDVTCVLTKGSYSDDDSSGTTTVHYRLEYDDQGGIKDAEASKTAWTEKSGEELQFIRYLIHPYRFTGPGDSRNRNVTQERLEQLFGDALKYNRIEDVAGAPTDGGLPTPTPGH